jgi:hypothetical protein
MRLGSLIFSIASLSSSVLKWPYLAAIFTIVLGAQPTIFATIGSGRRQAEVYPDGRINRLCAEHQREVNETFLRAMDQEAAHCIFIPGTRTVQ